MSMFFRGQCDTDHCNDDTGMIAENKGELMEQNILKDISVKTDRNIFWKLEKKRLSGYGILMMNVYDFLLNADSLEL